MPITIRAEKPEDYRKTEFLTREAFWDIYKPGCDEHLVVHNLRQVPAFVKQLDLVACCATEIIGNIMYSMARVVGTEGESREVLCLGPVSVLPIYQRKGIGSRLLTESLKLAKELGFNGVFLMGNPAYYSRFGFINAKEYKVVASDGESHDYFMGLELAPGRLRDISGKFFEDDAFRVDPRELEEFEKLFPRREKHITPTQLPR